MNTLTRRQFIQQTITTSLAAGAGLASLSSATSGESKNRKMTIDLTCGCIGVSANQREAIELAAKHGFESVGVDGGYLASLSDDQSSELKAVLKSKGLTFGAAGLPVEFRRDQDKFDESIKALPAIARGLKRAGLDRISTWLSPCDGKRTYLQNFRQHALRLGEVAKVLKDYNIRLGLEYVGPKTSWSSQRYPFIHTMAEMKDLIG